MSYKRIHLSCDIVLSVAFHVVTYDFVSSGAPVDLYITRMTDLTRHCFSLTGPKLCSYLNFRRIHFKFRIPSFERKKYFTSTPTTTDFSTIIFLYRVFLKRFTVSTVKLKDSRFYIVYNICLSHMPHLLQL